MIIAAAQTCSLAGNIEANTRQHLYLTQQAIANRANVIFFPELSLTGYSPSMAAAQARTQSAWQLEVFQQLSDQDDILIGLGVPLAVEGGVQIGMAWLVPNGERLFYAKQQLHDSERSCFIAGDRPPLIDIDGHRLAPAICFESLQMSHADSAASLRATVYLASVAHSDEDQVKEASHYPQVAKRHGMPVLLANGIGPSGAFISAGGSKCWSERGEPLAELDDRASGLVLFDTEKSKATAVSFADTNLYSA
ncbi:carbon-nitrogen hydrolase family protein [Halomonas sp. HNIBRBA4712]|uniref:carbon-nitrogen hydrolase family protein n=1 Tax=Halomonas sp. HNIBRBA4712 TaxID=3373087 RepID=UPI0037456BB3